MLGYVWRAIDASGVILAMCIISNGIPPIDWRTVSAVVAWALIAALAETLKETFK